MSGTSFDLGHTTSDRIDRLTMLEARDKLAACPDFVSFTDHMSYFAVFMKDDVAHVWRDGSVTWESDSVGQENEEATDAQ